MSEFILDKRLEADSVHLYDLRLCTVRLINDSRYPWVVLVPKVGDAVEMFDLDDFDYKSLTFEIKKISCSLSKEFKPYKVNIASLGNVVRQLHVHIVCRMEGDFAWPGPVWGVGKAVAYSEEELNVVVERIKGILK